MSFSHPDKRLRSVIDELSIKRTNNDDIYGFKILKSTTDIMYKHTFTIFGVIFLILFSLLAGHLMYTNYQYKNEINTRFQELEKLIIVNQSPPTKNQPQQIISQNQPQNKNI